MAAGQAEQANWMVSGMLKEYVISNQMQWEVKLLFALMAIRATHQKST